VDRPVQVRNQARVHLWYAEKFGRPLAPLASTGAGIANFTTLCACVGVCRVANGNLDFLAPFGLHDLFAMVARLNLLSASPETHGRKCVRWAAQWPACTVIP